MKSGVPYASMYPAEQRRALWCAIDQLAQGVWLSASRASVDTLRAHCEIQDEVDAKNEKAKELIREQFNRVLIERDQANARVEDLVKQSAGQRSIFLATIARLEAERDAAIAERDAGRLAASRVHHERDAVARFIDELASALAVESELRDMKKPLKKMRR